MSGVRKIVVKLYFDFSNPWFFELLCRSLGSSKNMSSTVVYFSLEYSNVNFIELIDYLLLNKYLQYSQQINQQLCSAKFSVEKIKQKNCIKPLVKVSYSYKNSACPFLSLEIKITLLSFKPIKYWLICFILLVSFDTPWKLQKTFGFLMFSGGIERGKWYEMD